MKTPVRYRTAFKESANVIGLATAVSLAAALLNPLPLLAGFVLEAAYLLFVPDSKWYGERLANRAETEKEKQRQASRARLLPGLPPNMQARFARLEEKRRQLAAPPGSEQLWFAEVFDNLDYLLDKFLFFASSEVRFREHLLAVREELSPAPLPAGGRPPTAKAVPLAQWSRETVAEVEQRFDREIALVEQNLKQESDGDTQAVLAKRLEVLRRRKEFAAKIGQILINLRHQLDLVEDTFGLINDELRARSPEQILADIEEVVGQTENMTKVLEEVAPYEQMVTRLRQVSI